MLEESSSNGGRQNGGPRLHSQQQQQQFADRLSSALNAGNISHNQSIYANTVALPKMNGTVTTGKLYHFYTLHFSFSLKECNITYHLRQI